MPSPSINLPSEGPGSPRWWRSQLQQSKEERDALKIERRDLVARYRDRVVKETDDDVRVNIEFEKVEQKRHQLFFQVPQLQLQPTPRTRREAEATQRDIDRSVRIFKEVLKRESGPRRMRTKALMDQNIFDTLVPGIGACVVGFERFTAGTVPVEAGRRPATDKEIDAFVQGNARAIQGFDVGNQMTGQGPTMPVFEQVPNQIAWRLFASRISPGHLYVPADFRGRDYASEADWLGFDLRVPIHLARQRNWKLPVDLKPSSMQDDDLMVERPERLLDDEHTVKVKEVWCYARRIYNGIAHPSQLRRLLFVEGQDEPVLVEDGRHQIFDPRGRLVRGIDTLPIKVLTLRYVSDHWAPPSDAWATKNLADELSEFRTQMVVHRKEAVPMRWINVEAIVDERIKRLVESGKYNGTVPVSGDGSQMMGEIAQAQYPRENYSGNDYVAGDINRQWALGSNQAGVAENRAITATESSLLQQATDNRLTGEKGIVVDYWLSIMETASKLLQIHLNEEDYVEVVGDAGAKEVIEFTRDDIQGEFLFDITPDSTERPDHAKARDLATNRWNLMSNSPFTQTEELHRDTMRKLGAEDDRFTRTPEPPQPEGPRVSLSVKSESLNPAMPEFQNTMAILQASGLDVSGLQTQPQNPEGVDDGQPVGPASAVDRDILSLNEAGSIDHRGGGLTDAGSIQ